MPFVKMYVHLVWSTKNREPFLNEQFTRRRAWEHIKQNSKSKGLLIDSVNGYSDHCHCLISLGTDQTIQKVVQMIKGESSFWINQQTNFLLKTSCKFQWQDDYFAMSVSESMLNVVRTYIHNQEYHHSKKTFEQEYNEIVAKLKFEDRY